MEGDVSQMRFSLGQIIDELVGESMDVLKKIQFFELTSEMQ